MIIGYKEKVTMNEDKRWKILKKLKDSSRFGSSNEEIIKLLLKNRGIKTVSQVKEFFDPQHPKDIPLRQFALDRKEVQKAINRIKLAKERNEFVVIYGDYDADGICATAILW